MERADAQTNLSLLGNIRTSSTAIINASELGSAAKAKLRRELEVAFHVLSAVLDRIEKEARK